MDKNSGEIIEKIDFDIAVSTKKGDKSKEGMVLYVGAIGLGIQGQVENENSTVSRLKFSVPLYLPENENE